MQAQIENLLLAYKAEQGREEKLLVQILSALAVGSEVRQRMVRDMSQAIVECKQAQASLNS